MARKFCENLECPQPLSARRKVKKCRIAGSRHFAYLCKRCEKRNLEMLKIIPVNPRFRKAFEQFMRYVKIKVMRAQDQPTVFGRKSD